MKVMKNIRRIGIFIGLLALLMTAAACTSSKSPAAMEENAGAESMMEDTIDQEMADESMDMEMAEDAQGEAMMDDSMDEEMAEEGHDDTMMDDSMDGQMAEPAPWQTLLLTDAATGETFTLADFKGQTVYVEPMATWCTNCRRQLHNVQQAINKMDDQEGVIFLALSLETNLRGSDLTSYAAREGYTMRFSVMSEEFLTALVDEFGRSAANAPSTPHFVIRPDGTFTELTTGFESADAVIELINSNRG